MSLKFAISQIRYIMQKSLKKNYILNLTNTISSLLFPLITFPYAARIIMAEGIGQINFYSSIISYISLFTSLGIPLYAIREIAKVRNSPQQLSITTTEIVLLHTGLTLIGYFVIFVIVVTFPKIAENALLFLLLSISIIFTAIGCEWFYQGIEDFKYITIRAITVKSICVILLFMLVKTRDDIMFYALYTVVGTVGNNLFNFFRLRKHIYVKYINIRELCPLRHLKPAIHVFVLNMVISIYCNLDIVMLGFLKDSSTVGYYTGATRLTKMLLAIVSSLGTVMVPRLSHLLNTNQLDEFKRISQKAVDFVIALSLPLSLGLIVTSHLLIRLFCGPTYEPAILTLQIISPILFLIALSGVMGIQILYPQGKENIVIKCTLIGAITNFTLNCFLIPVYANNGAAIATCIAELSVTMSMLVIGRRHLPVNYSIKRYKNYFCGSAIMLIIIYIITKIEGLPDIIILMLSTGLGIMTYFAYLYLRNDQLFGDLIVRPVKLYINRKKDSKSLLP